MKVCSYCGHENDDPLPRCAICGTELLDRSATLAPPSNHRPPPDSTAICPGCGAIDNYSPAVELRNSFSWPVFLAGGFLAVLFRNAGREKRVRCHACGTFFGICTPLSRLSRLIFWMLIAPTLFVIVILIFALVKSFFSD